MALQWSTPSPPEFPVLPTAVEVSATKDLGDGNSVSLTAQIAIGVEGPPPDESTVLEWLGVLYGALKTDGWTADLRFEETAVSRRFVEETEEP